MPVKIAKQYGLMAGVMSGSITGTGISRSVAKEFVHKTPAKKRKRFAQHLRNKT